MLPQQHYMATGSSVLVCLQESDISLGIPDGQRTLFDAQHSSMRRNCWRDEFLLRATNAACRYETITLFTNKWNYDGVIMTNPELDPKVSWAIWSCSPMSCSFVQEPSDQKTFGLQRYSAHTFRKQYSPSFQPALAPVGPCFGCVKTSNAWDMATSIAGISSILSICLSPFSLLLKFLIACKS
jgi:hypothetical protein